MAPAADVPTVVSKVCKDCGLRKSELGFSSKQWKTAAAKRRCKACIDGLPAVAEPNDDAALALDDAGGAASSPAADGAADGAATAVSASPPKRVRAKPEAYDDDDFAQPEYRGGFSGSAPMCSAPICDAPMCDAPPCDCPPPDCDAPPPCCDFDYDDDDEDDDGARGVYGDLLAKLAADADAHAGGPAGDAAILDLLNQTIAHAMRDQPAGKSNDEADEKRAADAPTPPFWASPLALATLGGVAVSGLLIVLKTRRHR